MATVIAEAKITQDGVVFDWQEGSGHERVFMTRGALESWVEALCKLHQRGRMDVDLTIVNPLG